MFGLRRVFGGVTVRPASHASSKPELWSQSVTDKKTHSGLGIALSAADPRQGLIDPNLGLSMTQAEYTRQKMEMYAAKEAVKPKNTSYTLVITAGTNQGYSITYAGELYIAANADELAQVIVAAIVKKKLVG